MSVGGASVNILGVSSRFKNGPVEPGHVIVNLQGINHWCAHVQGVTIDDDDSLG